MKPEHSAAEPAGTFDDLESLLSSAGVATIGELSSEIQQNEDVDTWLLPTNGAVLICTPVSGTELVFPFTWQDLWSVVTALEQDFIART